jgi:Family of unknown function (DUF5522)
MACCNNCNTQFNCDVNGNCWCMQYPQILTAEENAKCLCEACLKEKIIAKSLVIIADIKNGNDNVLEKVQQLPKTSILLEGLDYYTENSFFVFTAWYHLRKGYCCKNGCRHCPY